MNIKLNTLHVKIIANALKKVIVGLKIGRLSGGKSHFVLFLGGDEETDNHEGGSLHFSHVGDQSFLWFDPGYPPTSDVLWNPPIKGEIVEDIAAIADDRIICMELSKHTLHFELTGRRANIVCTDSRNNIVTALIPVDSSKSRHRQLLKGMEYSLPPSMGRKCPSQAEADEISRWITDTEMAVKESTVRSLNFWSLLSLEKKPIDLLSSFVGGDRAVSLYKGEIIPFVVKGSIGFDNIFECLREVATQDIPVIDLSHIFRQIERTKRRKSALEKELSSWREPEFYQHLADTLNANQYRLKKGSKLIVLPDVYQPEKMLDIELKPDSSIEENVQHYYDLVKRAGSALKNIPVLIAKVDAQIKSLQTLLDNPEEAKAHVKQQSKRALDKPKESKHYRTFSFAGYDIFVGKNAAGNDYLTLRMAKPWDIWLHARNSSGSHVLIRLPDKKEPPSRVVVMAAQIAAFYSNLRHQTGAEVIWTFRKWVQKVRKKTGAVKLMKDFTVTVDPISEKTLNRLKKMP